MKLKLNFLESWIENISIFLLLVMVILVSLAVILRYFFHTGIMWSEEFVRYAYIWLIFLGSITCIKENANISLSIFLDKLPLRIRTIISLLGDVLIIFFLVIIVIYGFDLCIKVQGMVSPIMNIPKSWIYLIFPISSLFMFFEMLKIFCKHWNRLRE